VLIGLGENIVAEDFNVVLRGGFRHEAGGPRIDVCLSWRREVVRSRVFKRFETAPTKTLGKLLASSAARD